MLVNNEMSFVVISSILRSIGNFLEVFRVGSNSVCTFIEMNMCLAQLRSIMSHPSYIISLHQGSLNI
jgi:hypothetical protein